MLCHFDSPSLGERCDPLGFSVAGWVHDSGRHHEFEALEIRAGDALLGETRKLAVRPDVAAALALPQDIRVGFEVFCQYPAATPAEGANCEVWVRFAGDQGALAGSVRVSFIVRDHRRLHYGRVLERTHLPILHRDQVYASGPSYAEGSDECLALLRKYLPVPPVRLLDVGCGLGWYGSRLLAAGYDWHGAEMKARDCAHLAERGLPHTRVDGRELPFETGAFDAALSIEVLEHTEEPEDFVAEISRVAPLALAVSVPNFEPVPILQTAGVVPWHLLEADHRNFFTRWSLQHLLERFYTRVEVTCYHPLPVRTPDGVRVYSNLFAFAES